MLLRSLLSLFFIIVVSGTHAHWKQPPEPIPEPIVCPGHSGTYAIIQKGNKLFTVVVYKDNRVAQMITRAYPIYTLQFSSGCAKLMLVSEEGRESIDLYDENHLHP